jgi:hypothetical protein
LEQQFTPLVLQSASSGQAWHDRSVRINVTETGSYGHVSAAVPYQLTPAGTSTMQPGMPTQMMPGQPAMMPGQSGTSTATLLSRQGSIDFGSADGNAAIAWLASRATSLSLFGGFGLAGGLSSDARLVIAQQYGPRAGAYVSTSLSRSDAIVTTISGHDTLTSGPCTIVEPTSPNALCREEVPVVQVAEGLRHRISRTAMLGVDGGVAATVAPTPGLNELVIVPTVRASLSDSWGLRGTSSYSVTAAMTPTVDIRTGLPSNRAQVNASYSELLMPRVTLNLTGGLAQSLPFPAADPFPLTSLTGGVEARIRLDRQVDLGLGVLAYAQHQFLPSTGPDAWSATEVGFVSVTARAPTLHF